MGLDFNYFLNRQGIQGKRGERGEQGFSPLISVKTQTANEYVLTVQNEDGSFDTPNLRGNAIANNGGTYIRYNPLTEEMYTGNADYATNEQAGVVLLASYEQLIAGGSENLIPTSEDVYNFVTQQIISGFVSQQEFDTYTAATAITLNNLATQKLSFTDLASALVEGDNITLDVDSENHTITINAAGGDLSNYVTLDTTQTITGGKTFEFHGGDIAIKSSPFKFRNYTSSCGDIFVGSNLDNAGIVVDDSNGLTLGYDSMYWSRCLYLPTGTYNAFIVKGYSEYVSGGIVDDSRVLPIFTEDTLLAGTGITITPSGSRFSKTYTISADAPDLSNYMTLDTVQTITARKLFATIYNINNRNLVSYDSNNTANRIGNTTDVLDLSGYGIRPTYTAYNQSPVSLALLSDIPSNTITLTSLSIDSGSTNYLEYDNTTGEFGAKVDTTVTQNSSKLVTSGAVYDAIQSSVGNIETLLNNINSGSGS